MRGSGVQLTTNLTRLAMVTVGIRSAMGLTTLHTIELYTTLLYDTFTKSSLLYLTCIPKLMSQSHH